LQFVRIITFVGKFTSFKVWDLILYPFKHFPGIIALLDRFR
jgi:hypothetical protein